MAKIPVSKDVTDLLLPFAPEIRDLALAARSFVLQEIPGITEQVDLKARIVGYAYGSRHIDMVCMIMPTKPGVNLGIAYAMEPPDPKKLLEGTGKAHRHVKLKSSVDLQNSALKSLLQAANDAAIARRESAARPRRK